MSIQERELVQRAVADALDTNERVVLAVSGGLDSMVLLHAATHVAERRRLSVATFDHRTGAAATAASALVARRCAELGIACDVGRADGALRAEAELRDARWRFLRRVARERSAVVATAHTEDDQIETVLMRVMRGAGARGLAALYAASPVLRPLVALRRAQLVAYAQTTRVEWVEDPSNESKVFLRNRLRHDILPALRRTRPGIDAELLGVARDAAAWRDDLERFVATTLVGQTVDRRGGIDVGAGVLANRSVAELSILWPALVARAGLTLDRRGIARLAEFTSTGRVGAQMQLAGGWRVIRSRDAFQFRASAQRTDIEAVALSGEVSWGEWSFRPADQPGGNDPMSAHLPAGQNLSIRSWRPGDTMVAHAGRPARKVKQLLSRAGITGHDRTGWPVVLSGDHIVWIPGVRRADAASERSGKAGLTFVCEHHRR